MTDKPIILPLRWATLCQDDQYRSNCKTCKRDTIWRRSETWPTVYICTGGCESTKMRQRARGPK